MLTSTNLKRFIPVLLVFLGALALTAEAAGPKGAAPTPTGVKILGERIEITAGPLVRTLELTDNRIRTTSLRVDGAQLDSGPSPDFRVTFHQADPNQRPIGLKPGEAQALDFEKAVQNWHKLRSSTNIEGVKMEFPLTETQSVQWKDPMVIDGERMAQSFRIVHAAVSTPRAGVTRLNIRARVNDGNHPLHHVAIDLFYEVYDGYPVIRKWIELANNGPKWLKIDGLTIDAIELAPAFRSKAPLTPQENGACSSVIGFGMPGSRGA